jgi:hypothetical protein
VRYLSSLSLALSGLGIALSLTTLSGCGSRSGTESADSATVADSTKPVVVDTIALKRAAMRRDSLKADSIVKKSGQLPGAILPGHRIVAFTATFGRKAWVF